VFKNFVIFVLVVVKIYFVYISATVKSKVSASVWCVVCLMKAGDSECKKIWQFM